MLARMLDDFINYLAVFGSISQKLNAWPMKKLPPVCFVYSVGLYVKWEVLSSKAWIPYLGLEY